MIGLAESGHGGEVTGYLLLDLHQHLLSAGRVESRPICSEKSRSEKFQNIIPDAASDTRKTFPCLGL